MKIQIIVTTSSGSQHSTEGRSEAVFSRTRELGDGNPSYNSRETWERGGAMLTDVVRQIEKQFGPCPDDTYKPTVFEKPTT